MKITALEPGSDYILRTTGDSEKVSPQNPSGGYSLEELYRHTGSHTVEIVLVPGMSGMILVVDEEGLLEDRELNPLASFLTGRTIVGDVLLCRDENVQ